MAGMRKDWGCFIVCLFLIGGVSFAVEKIEKQKVKAEMSGTLESKSEDASGMVWSVKDEVTSASANKRVVISLEIDPNKVKFSKAPAISPSSGIKKVSDVPRGSAVYIIYEITETGKNIAKEVKLDQLPKKETKTSTTPVATTTGPTVTKTTAEKTTSELDGHIQSITRDASGMVWQVKDESTSDLIAKGVVMSVSIDLKKTKFEKVTTDPKLAKVKTLTDVEPKSLVYIMMETDSKGKTVATKVKLEKLPEKEKEKK